MKGDLMSLRTLLSAVITGVLALTATLSVSVSAAAPARAYPGDPNRYVVCHDKITPVHISVIRVNATSVSIGTWSPVGGIVHFYADGNGANNHAAFHAASLPANVHLYHLIHATLGHTYWIAHVPYAGTLWTDPYGKFIGSCHSPLHYTR